MAHHIRDEIVDFVRAMVELTELPERRWLGWIGLSRGKFNAWKSRYGKANEHNALVPRDFWLEPQERDAIIDFHDRNPLEGYRRLTYMMLDQDIVAVSPSSTYRVLRAAGRIDQYKHKPSKKGTGFVQPLEAHDHWHIDISYINVCGTFFYLCSVLDGYSRFIVHWELRESMLEQDVEVILQRSREKYPEAKPRIISDNGPQFIAKDFKEFIRIAGMTHVRTSPNYPQSNGKLERWHKSIKSEAVRVTPPDSLEQGRQIIGKYVEHYNHVRLHSALDYVTPFDFLHGRAKAICADRDRKLEAAREIRRQKRAAQ